MSVLNKVLIFLGAILLAGVLSFIVYKQVEISNRQLTIESQVILQKELADNIMRSQNSYATKDYIDKIIKTNGLNLKVIQDDLDKLHAEVTAVNVILVTSKGQHIINVPTTTTGPVNPNPIDPTNPDPYGYMSRQQNLDINEDFGDTKVPIGKIGFSAWQKLPWSIDILAREYRVTNVLGTDENQRSYVYNKVSVKVADKTYDVKIATAQTEQVYPQAKWSWWNPRLNIGADGGINISQIKGEFTPTVGISVFSYGMYKNSPDFAILSAGVGYGTVAQKVQAVITPFSYNIGKHIPLMNNTYIAPSLHVGFNGDISIMGGIRVGL